MKGLVFAQEINKEGRHDATGAFIPGARHFAKKHLLGEPIWLDDTNDRDTVIDGIANARGLNVIAYFGHGTPNGLPSANITKKHLDKLASAIIGAAASDCRVIFYACSTGIPNGFAQDLADRLGGHIVVYGHTCPGHSFTNPYVTRYPFVYEDTQPFLVEPGGTYWGPWYRHIKGKSDIWMRFPFMSKEEVEAELEGS